MASSDALPGPRRPRPMSPHLSIYRLTMTMAMSIAHRISGAALYVGVLLLAWFLIAASADAATFAVFSEFTDSSIGRLVLFVFSWALFHHLARRHSPYRLGRRLWAGRAVARSNGVGDVDRRVCVDDRRLGRRLRRPVGEHRDGR